MAELLDRLKAALADRYQIEREIGSGGMAIVYLALDLKHNRKVAVKVLHPDLAATLGADRFLREIEIAAKLTHPHIMPLYDSGEAAGLLYHVMPYVEEETLRDRLTREIQLPVVDALRIGREIADALSYAHSMGVIHRDIKPENVLFEAGHAVIADFGIARAIAEAGEGRLTDIGLAVGTPAYMSPEQAAGAREVDGRSDIYSLGCVLYEMLGGDPPFTGSTPQAILARKTAEAAPSLRVVRDTVPDGLETVVMKTLARAPADRFSTAAQLVEALATADSAISLQAVPTRRRRIPRPVLAVAAAVILVSVGAAVAVYSSSDIGFDRRDWILITDVQNTTGDSLFNRSLNTALTVALQQSQYVNVFPQTRIVETLQRMQREDVGPIDEVLGREIALRENVRVLVVPSIDRFDSVYVLAIRVVDPTTGEDLKARSSRATGTGEILAALDKLARRLRRDLGESLLAITRRGIEVGRATTPSLEALQAWSEAQWHWGYRRHDEAIALYQRAIELDSNFAMAHSDLGGAYFWLGDRSSGEHHFNKALSLADRVTERERLWIQAESDNWMENREAAIGAYNIFLGRYPDDLSALFRLGYALLLDRQTLHAIDAFERVAEIDSGDAAAQVNLATSYRQLGRNADALPYYLKAFELSPEWLTSSNLNHEFGFNYAEMGDLESAQETFEHMLSGNDEQRGLGLRSLGLLKMYEGKYGDAREHFRQSAVLHQALGIGLSELRTRLYLAVAYRANGTMGAFREELARVRELAPPASIAPNWLAYLGKAHARSGLVGEAEQLLADAVARLDEENSTDRAAVALLRGEVALARGENVAAITYFQTAYAVREDNYYLESLAYAYFVSGDLEAAEDRYLAIVAEPDLGWEAQEPWILAHYQLGRIHQQQGNVAQALEDYRRFLEIWQDGDDDLTALIDARRRADDLSDAR